MTILFLTDSLSLPRDGKIEKVKYEDTYPFLLKKKFAEHDFIFLGIGGATITDLHRQSSYYKGVNPDLVFIQCGIVDCAPRPFRKLETKIINKLKLRFLFKPVVKYLVKHRNYKYTKPNTFNTLLSKMKNDFFFNAKVYGIGILPASEQYEQKLKGITKSIKTYNLIIADNLIYIDNIDFPEDGVLSDFHHLNKKGHKFIFKKLEKIRNG